MENYLLLTRREIYSTFYKLGWNANYQQTCFIFHSLLCRFSQKALLNTQYSWFYLLRLNSNAWYFYGVIRHQWNSAISLHLSKIFSAEKRHEQKYKYLLIRPCGQRFFLSITYDKWCLYILKNTYYAVLFK